MMCTVHTYVCTFTVATGKLMTSYMTSNLDITLMSVVSNPPVYLYVVYICVRQCLCRLLPVYLYLCLYVDEQSNNLFIEFNSECVVPVVIC